MDFGLFLPYWWLYQAGSGAELNVDGNKSVSSSSGCGPVHQESIDKSLRYVF